ncbi:hypothetical protein Hypma_001145 [Hypsizygus marmoreus]|uniref:Uncharacterized protein n=1 Tax=Hypsizygus marmoreus TaxID=39966 RepID=A0A369JAC0_HYPMA|nr:hypothetical protein Hypma_001145 [Hypsizygus marmoreus]
MNGLNVIIGKEFGKFGFTIVTGSMCSPERSGVLKISFVLVALPDSYPRTYDVADIVEEAQRRFLILDGTSLGLESSSSIASSGKESTGPISNVAPEDYVAKNLSVASAYPSPYRRSLSWTSWSMTRSKRFPSRRAIERSHEAQRDAFTSAPLGESTKHLSAVSLPPLSPPPWVAKIPKVVAVVYATRNDNSPLPITPPEPAVPKIVPLTCTIGSYNGTAQAEDRLSPLPFCPPFTEPLPNPVFVSSTSTWVESIATPSTITSNPYLPATALVAPFDLTSSSAHETCVVASGPSAIPPLGNGVVFVWFIVGVVVGLTIGKVPVRRKGMVATLAANVIASEKVTGEITVFDVPAIVPMEAIEAITASSLATVEEVNIDLAAVPVLAFADSALDGVEEEAVNYSLVDAEVIDPVTIALPPSEEDEVDEQFQDAIEPAAEVKELDPATVPLPPDADDELEELTINPVAMTQELDPATIPLPPPHGDDDLVDEVIVVVDIVIIDPTSVPLPGEEDEEPDLQVSTIDDVDATDPTTIPLPAAADDEVDEVEEQSVKIRMITVEVIDPAVIPLPPPGGDEPPDNADYEVVDPMSVPLPDVEHDASDFIEAMVDEVDIAIPDAPLDPAFIPLPNPDAEELESWIEVVRHMAVEDKQIDLMTVPFPSLDEGELETLDIQVAGDAKEHVGDVAFKAVLILVAAGMRDLPPPTPDVSIVGPIDLRFVWCPRPIRPSARTFVNPYPTRLPLVPDAGEAPHILRPFRRRGTLHRWLSVMPTLEELEETVEKPPKLICPAPARRLPPPKARSRMVSSSSSTSHLVTVPRTRYLTVPTLGSESDTRLASERISNQNIGPASTLLQKSRLDRNIKRKKIKISIACWTSYFCLICLSLLEPHPHSLALGFWTWTSWFFDCMYPRIADTDPLTGRLPHEPLDPDLDPFIGRLYHGHGPLYWMIYPVNPRILNLDPFIGRLGHAGWIQVTQEQGLCLSFPTAKPFNTPCIPSRPSPPTLQATTPQDLRPIPPLVHVGAPQM